MQSAWARSNFAIRRIRRRGSTGAFSSSMSARNSASVARVSSFCVSELESIIRISPCFARATRAPMKVPRRQFLHLAAGAAALPAVSRIASAQTYPARPVHIIVGYAPGGSTDIVARLIGQWLSERLGQQFIIDNRPGASGNIATELVVRAPPDGNTLLLALSSDAINATLYDNLNFNFIRDITPVAGIVRVPNVM